MSGNDMLMLLPIGDVSVNEAKLCIGNSLLENDVAIIDKLSHRYFPN